MCQLESDHFTDARKTFQNILAATPNTPLRPLITFYGKLLAAKEIQEEGSSDEIPTGPDIFQQEEEGTTKKTTPLNAHPSKPADPPSPAGRR